MSAADTPRDRASRALPPAPSIGRHLLIGMVTLCFGFFGFVAWLFAAQLSGAVMAVGQVVIDGEIKRVQHPAGGVIGRIAATNGQRVKAGDVLIRLDDTIPRTNLAQIISQLVQQLGRKARLEAERDDRERLLLPADFMRYGTEAGAVAAGEQRLLTENRALRLKQIEQLQERIGQYEREIEGMVAQITGKREEARLIGIELRGVLELYEKNLIPIGRVSALQREAARLEGESGALTANMAKVRGQIAEINLQLIQIDQKIRTDAVRELRDVEGSIAQLIERRAAAEDLLMRIEIRAPQSGFVHELVTHTIGGVIAPGQVIMAIVPDDDLLSVEMRVQITDIDQIHMGQRVSMRMSAFNQRTTSELWGRISRIAADATREQQTGMSYYLVRARFEPGELAKLHGQPLTSGMPVETFIETTPRSAMSYFARPLIDAFHRAFRED